jgi:hypothetical protein
MIHANLNDNTGHGLRLRAVKRHFFSLYSPATSSATVSICAVWGNMSTGSLSLKDFPDKQKSPRKGMQ